MDPGDAKFELATHLQKPSKSIHTTCVTAMPASLHAPSCAWLQRHVSKPGIGEFDKELFERSLHDLQTLRMINQRSVTVWDAVCSLLQEPQEAAKWATHYLNYRIIGFIICHTYSTDSSCSPSYVM